MPNRLASTAVPNALINPSVPQETLELFAGSVINGGMVTQVDRVDIDDSQLSLAQNVSVRYDVTSRRTGTTLLTPAKPDTNKVLGLISFKHFDNTIQFFRFTKNSIYIRGGTWTQVTGAALNGLDSSHIQFLSVNNRAFFSNQVDPLQEININANTYAPAGNAPQYKYYCTFGGRIVGANLAGATPSPIQVGWCGDNNFTQFDPTVDFSAGSTPLIDSPEDFSDFITGLYGFSNSMIVVRERSIWMATRQASATNPYYFYNAVPGTGCDTPRSIARIARGIVWYDRRLGNVFSYEIANNVYQQLPPTPIGDAVRKSINSQIIDPDQVFAGFDPVNNEYTIGFPNATTAQVNLWKYNFMTKSWCYDVINNVSSIDALDYTQNTGAIKDLSGSISSLLGTISSLSPSLNTPTLFYGRNDGDILQLDPTATTDAGTSYTTDVKSKIYQLTPVTVYIAQLHIEYVPTSAGSFTIAYSKDGGATFHDYKTIKFTVDNVGSRLTAVCVKNIRARTYMWRVYSSSGTFDLVGYNAYVFPTGGYTRAKTS